LVCFAGLDGRRREISTSMDDEDAAMQRAQEIIHLEYTPPEPEPGDEPEQLGPTWDEATSVLKRHMAARDLRQTSIDQYMLVLNTLKKSFPETHGPASITPAMAQEFAVKRKEDGKSARTIRGNLDNLEIVYNWLRVKTRMIDTANPFELVDRPKEDAKPIRVISDAERKSFFEWLAKRWDWRLPLLFLECKAALGCRVTELAKAKSDGLADGKIRFESVSTKGRKQRRPKLPKALYDELVRIKGQTFVFERFPAELKALHEKSGRARSANLVNPIFDSVRLRHWLQEECRIYNKLPGVEKFTLHNFRATAVSKARALGLDERDASIAFGCNVETMRQHYTQVDEDGVVETFFDSMNDPNYGVGRGRREGELTRKSRANRRK